MSAPGRVLGLDLGDARIGVAISDPDRRLAVPLGTVHVGRPPGEMKAIASLVADNEVERIVVGDPRTLSGASGTSSHHARAFASALASFVQVPIELQDERLSTIEAERTLRDAGMRGRAIRERVDPVAATVILQAWLDAHGEA